MRVISLVGLVAVAVFLWMLPVLLMGFPPHLPDLDAVRALQETGMIPYGDGHLSVMLLGFFSQWIGWDQTMLWTALGALALGIALAPLWWSVKRLFGDRVAWCTVAVVPFMPIYFQEAIGISDYTFAYAALFLSLAAFIGGKDRMLFLGISGLFFGACLGFKDAFIIFLPWMTGAYLWLHRSQWKRALAGTVVFLACAGLVYTVPVLPRAIGQGDIMTIIPLGRLKPMGEFYPDRYTYDFEREAYEQEVLKDRQQGSRNFLDSIRGYNRLILFDIGEQNFFLSLLNGAWLFINRIPSLFFLDTVGGVILWLFIIPGAALLYRKDRQIFWVGLGLIVTSELILRFVLHYQRIHLMNYGWMLAMAAALGMDTVTRKSAWWMAGVCLVVVLHLLQVNRVELALAYNRSTVPDRIAVAATLKELPDGSHIAVPTNFKGVSAISGRDMMIFREATIERLLTNGKLREIFNHYGVTHVLRYPDELMRRIVKADPSTQFLEVAEGKRPPVTPMMKYLLHLFR